MSRKRSILKFLSSLLIRKRGGDNETIRTSNLEGIKNSINQLNIEVNSLKSVGR